jgi:hypothetical protein
MPLSKNSAPFIGPFPDRTVTVVAGWLCLLLIGGLRFSPLVFLEQQ